jgi:hypothetical protein
MHRSKILFYSITSSARASSVGGTVRPSVRAVCALMTSTNLVDCIDAGGRGGDGCRWSEPLPLPIQASVERRDQLPFKVPVRGYLGSPAILGSGPIKSGINCQGPSLSE